MIAYLYKLIFTVFHKVTLIQSLYSHRHHACVNMFIHGIISCISRFLNALLDIWKEEALYFPGSPGANRVSRAGEKDTWGISSEVCVSHWTHICFASLEVFLPRSSSFPIFIPLSWAIIYQQGNEMKHNTWLWDIIFKEIQVKGRTWSQ